MKVGVHLLPGPHNWGPLHWGVYAAALVCIDLLTRVSCFSACAVTFFPGFGLHPFANSRFAFSIPMDLLWMYVVYFSVCAAIVWYVSEQWAVLARGQRAAWLAVLCGAVVNIFERLLTGYVRDFIQIGTGYMNLGDVYIIAGVAYILYVNMRISQKSSLH